MNLSFSFRTPQIAAENLELFNARSAPFRIHGLYHPERGGLFRRMPSEVAQRVSPRVTLLHTHTAGARLRFATNSTFIAVGATYPPMTFSSPRSALLSGAGACCFDLFVDGSHSRVMCPRDLKQEGSVVSFDLKSGRYESSVSFSEKKLRQITLCFPSFVNVSELFIGLKEGSILQEAEPYPNEDPVVFYGSSITQGACASRSGNTYQNRLSARLGFDYVNLGFAGACKAEETMIDYLCSIKTPLLMFDYDHNVSSSEALEKTHLSSLRKLRAAHPKIPIVLMSKPNQHNGEEEALRRMEIIRHSYEVMKKESPAPIYFVNGQEIFHSHDSDMMTIDNTHPTDFGFYCVANALMPIFEKYFPVKK